MTAEDYATLIPDEAVEAAARAMCQHAYAHVPALDWEKQLQDPYWLEQARAACAAMLAAWPFGAVCHYKIANTEGHEMVLPLPEVKP